MNMNEYQAGCLETWSGDNRLERSVLGLVGEGGEVAECSKKYLRGDFNHKEYIKRIKKELGDVLYYVTVAAVEHGMDLPEIAEANREKLKSRKERGVISGSGDNR